MANHRNQVNFIKKWEGGLSNDPRDVNPAAFPAPCVYNGQSGWHTNKGITYRTFHSNAARLGYAATCDNFIRMPDYIWLKIYKAGFWDKFLLDGYRSQAIADIVVSLAWGSGIGGAYRQLAKFLNANFGTDFPTSTSGYSIDNAKQMRELFNKHTRMAGPEKRVHAKLIRHLQQFYISLNNPTYIRGWLNRVNALYDFTYDSLKAANEERKYLIVGIAAGTLAVATLLGHFLADEKPHRQAA